MPNVLPDALREALGQVIADQRREWRRERELIEAQSREVVAELRAKIAELERDIRESATTKLAAVKDGDPGRDGIDGRDGADGAPGRDGADGAPGRDGADGKSVTVDDLAPLVAAEVARAVADLPAPKDGAPGKDADPELVRAIVAEAVAALPPAERGPPGDPGPAGALPIVKDWSDRVHYAGEVVSHDGSTWQAARDTGRSPPHEDWVCLARAGCDGADGRSFTVRGTFSATVDDYRELDVVVLGGAAFVARRDSPGQCPGEGWQMISAQGKRGHQGERGAQGARGEPGPAAIAMAVDGEGMLTIVNVDGSTVECDLYPILAKIAG